MREDASGRAGRGDREIVLWRCSRHGASRNMVRSVRVMAILCRSTPPPSAVVESPDRGLERYSFCVVVKVFSKKELVPRNGHLADVSSLTSLLPC